MDVQGAGTTSLKIQTAPKLEDVGMIMGTKEGLVYGSKKVVYAFRPA